MLNNTDRVLARELALYARNDSHIYQSRIEPFIVNFIRKKVRGVFNKQRAIEGLANNLAKDVQRAYLREFFERTLPIMSHNDKIAFGEEMLDEMEEIIRGYSKLLKIRKGKRK